MLITQGVKSVKSSNEIIRELMLFLGDIQGDSSTIVCSVKVKYAWCCCANLFNLPSQTLRIGGRVRKNCFCSNNRCSHKSSKSSSELWGKNICACSLFMSQN